MGVGVEGNLLWWTAGRKYWMEQFQGVRDSGPSGILGEILLSVEILEENPRGIHGES